MHLKTCSRIEGQYSLPVLGFLVGFGASRVITYLEVQRDLVSRLIMGIIRVTIWVISVINLLTKSP